MKVQYVCTHAYYVQGIPVGFTLKSKHAKLEYFSTGTHLNRTVLQSPLPSLFKERVGTESD